MFGVDYIYVVVSAKFWLLSCSKRLSLAGRSICSTECHQLETYQITLAQPLLNLVGQHSIESFPVLPLLVFVNG